MTKQKRKSKNTTKRPTKKAGKKNTTSTATSYGYGASFRTSARSRSAAKGKIAPYQSKYEHLIAKNLTERGIDFDYEPRQIPYTYPVKRGICNSCGADTVGRRASYTPDFWLPDYQLWVEAKGRWDASGRTKILAILETSEEITRDNFKILFMYDNWITKKHKLTYTAWCKRHQILSHVGDFVPKDWLG